MSMWEIESLTEAAIRLVAASEALSPQERRTFYANLYDLQEQHDCSYTHFRLPELLMRDGFFHRIEFNEHPAYAAHGPALDALIEGKSEAWIPMDPNDEGFATAAFWESGKDNGQHSRAGGLYFDIRSPLWRPLVDSGRLEGLAAEPFETWSDTRAFARIMRLAAKTEGAEGRDVLHGYYGFALWCLPWCEAPAPPGEPELTAVLQLPEVRARLIETPDDWIAERFTVPEPQPDDSAEMKAFLAWWRTPLS